jgi:capsular polysaccharide biosynthesis protein
MDSNKVNVNEERDFDIRDVGNYLLGKIWIVLLAIVCFAIIAIIYTSTITPAYTSTSTAFVINAQDNTVSSSHALSGISLGKQLAITSPELITKEFCDVVAENLNESPAFQDFYCLKDEYGNLTRKLTGNDVFAALKVSSDEETCIVTFTVTTTNAHLSKYIANEVARSFGDHIKTFIKIDTISAEQAKFAVASASPSNIHTTRNAVLAAMVGAIFACAVLIVVFMFDDKIKTPDDVDRYLGLSVLGVIPEIDTEE